MRERRAKYEARSGIVRDVLAAGREYAHKLGRETLEKAHEAMGMSYKSLC